VSAFCVTVAVNVHPSEVDNVIVLFLGSSPVCLDTLALTFPLEHDIFVTQSSLEVFAVIVPSHLSGTVYVPINIPVPPSYGISILPVKVKSSQLHFFGWQDSPAGTTQIVDAVQFVSDV
jgi:hypothetical protein